MDESKNKTKKHLIENKASDQVGGLGDDVVKIIDADDDKTICFIGFKNDIEQVHFAKPANIEQLEAVLELLHKKKFQRYLNHGKIEKAQAFANRKFSS